MAGRTYQQLIDAATLNLELFTESIQNKGTVSVGAMSVVGSPQLNRFANSIGLQNTNRGAAAYIVSAGTAAVVDVTTAFTVEFVSMFGQFAQYLCYQVQGGGLGGGWTVYFNGVSTIFLLTYTAAAGNARLASCVIPDPIVEYPHHFVAQLDPVGLSGQIWIDNVAITTTFTNTAPPVAGAALLYVVNAAAPADEWVERLRAWQGALDAGERMALYQNYRGFVRPSKV